MPSTLRIATRKSPLAVWQAEHVAALLRQAHPGLAVELVKMSTRGDKILDAPLARIGGKGLFLKELEQGLLEGRADIAVHSMKDVPAEITPELHVPVIPERGDPHDAFVSNHYDTVRDLPRGARVGTASLRRQCQIKAARPDLEVLTLRGSVNTRLGKLDDGEFDAIVLAASGLKRLGMDARITRIMPAEESLPAVGQGALGIQCRQNDADINALIAALNHERSNRLVSAERAVNRRLEGSCQVPIAAHAQLQGEEVFIRALVGAPDGSRVIRGEIKGPADQGEALGDQLASDLLDRGADRILRELFEAD